MGIRIKKRANGTNAYVVEIRHADFATRRGTYDTREEAEKVVAEVRAEMRAVKSASAAARLAELAKGKRPYGRAKLADVIIAYIDSPKCSKRGRKALKPTAVFVKNVAIEGIDDEWSERYVAIMRSTLTSRGAPYAYSTLMVQLIYIALACKWWAKQNGIRNPEINVSNAFFPRDWEVKRERRLEDGEHERLLEKIRKLACGADHWECFYLLSLETGARLQELAFAEWKELEHGDQLWRIPAGHTKKRTTRRVPLSPRAREVVKKLRSLAKADDPRIFHAMGTAGAISQRFAKLVDDAEIEGLRLHDLRHEAISRMCVHKTKVPIKAIMDIVGHRTYEAFLRYSHMRDDELIGLLD